MVDEIDAFVELHQAIEHSTGVEAVVEILADHQSLLINTDLSLEQHDTLFDIFRVLREWTVNDFANGRLLILNYLLPYLENDGEGNNRIDHLLSLARKRLTEWIDQYPDPQRFSLRQEVLNQFVDRLSVAELPTICWTISAIGFRQPNVVAALWQLVASVDAEVGDTALAVLTGLGILSSQHSRVLTSLHQRATSRFSITLTFALERLADPASIPLIRDCWLNSSDANLQRPLAWNVLNAVADVWYNDATVQKQIWDVLIASVTDDTEQGFYDIFVGSLVAQCNSPSVVPQLLAWIPSEKLGSQNPAHYRYLLGSRLMDCIRPAQLGGWHAPLAAATLVTIEQDAGQNTHRAISFQTTESLHKEMAWDVLLCAGRQ